MDKLACGTCDAQPMSMAEIVEQAEVYMDYGHEVDLVQGGVAYREGWTLIGYAITPEPPITYLWVKERK